MKMEERYMKEKIKDKIEELTGYLQKLLEITPANLEEYKTDWKTKAASERFCEKIAEATVDLAFLIFKEELEKDKNIKIPKDDPDVFEILREKGIISERLCKRLAELKGMRNWLAHEYEEVDDEIVYNAITSELQRDVEEFIETIKKRETIK